MKSIRFVIPILCIGILSSCASYYQIYEATPSDGIKNNDSNLVYEDENCIITYYLWADGGDIGFEFYNKTNEEIYLDLSKSFFILNGEAHDYYKNRVYSASITSAATINSSFSEYYPVTETFSTNNNGIKSSRSHSITYNEKEIIIIPSKTTKNIAEYNIVNSLYRDCDLFKYPRITQVNKKTFTIDNSPIVFSNRIAYSIGETDKLINLENEFFVSSIANYPEKLAVEKDYIEYCGQKSGTKSKHIVDIAPNKFYIKYEKGEDTWKH